MRQVAQEAERDLVAPVDVIDDQRERPPFGQIRRQPVEAVEHCKPRLGALLGRRGSDQPAGELGGPREEFRSLLRRRPHDDGLEELAHEAAAEAALELGAPGRVDVEQVLPGQLHSGFEKRRLADARGSLDQDRAPRIVAAGDRDRRVQRGQLQAAFPEGGAVIQGLAGGIHATILGVVVASRGAQRGTPHRGGGGHEEIGFTRFRRATETPFNLVLEVRP